MKVKHDREFWNAVLQETIIACIGIIVFAVLMVKCGL
jgi:hypothetical protein